MESLKKYKKQMDRMYYIFLVIILLYEILGSTSLLYYLTVWIAGKMSGMDPALAGLIFQSVVNLRFLIIIPAIYVVVAEARNWGERALLGGMLLLGWIYLFYMREWNDTVMFKAMIMLVASYGKDFRKIAKYSMWVSGSIMFLALVLSLLGIIPEFNMVRNNVVRHSFGTLGPTTFAGHVAAILITLIFIRDWKLKWFDLALLVIMSVLNLLFVDGRAALLEVVLATGAAVCFMFIHRRELAFYQKGGEIIRKILLWSYVILMAGYMWMMVSYNPDPEAFYHKIPFLSSFEGRISVPHNMLDQLPPSLFGNYFEKYDSMSYNLEDLYVSGEYTFLDSSYARLYMIYGIVGMLAGVLVFTGIQYRLYKKKQTYRMLLLAIVGFIYVVQRGLFEPGSNILLLLLFADIDGLIVNDLPQKNGKNRQTKKEMGDNGK